MPINQRIRDNNVFGTVSDNPLTAGSLTLNSGGLINLSSIVAKHAIITLDPLRQFGSPEIIIVTSHTASATVATISRGAYGTIPRQHPSGTLWVHAPTNEDFIQILSSGSRPSDPYEGQFIFEMDTNKLYAYGGVDWAPRDAGGQLGYAEIVANTAQVSAETDIPGLSVAVTVGTGRRILITGHIGFDRTVIDGLTRLRIKEGATDLQNKDANTTTAGNGSAEVTALYVTTPSAGAHTYKLSLAVVTGTGTTRVVAGATLPSFILVEDIGAA